MIRIILITAFILSLSSLLILECQKETDEETLAYRMSESEYFPAIIAFGERTAMLVESMPDSTKNKFRQDKIQIEAIQKNVTLNVFQKRDSIVKIIRYVSVLTPELAKLASDTTKASIFRNFYSEFPEYAKLSGESKSVVFKMAFKLYWKRSALHM